MRNNENVKWLLMGVSVVLIIYFALWIAKALFLLAGIV